MIKPITLIHVSKALLGYATENKELGLPDVSCLYPGTEIEKYKLKCHCPLPNVKGFTGQQKKVYVIETSCCIEMHFGFLDILSDILLSLRN